MTGLEVFFIVLNYVSVAPIILVLVYIIRQQRKHHHRQKALEEAVYQLAPSLQVAATPVPVQSSTKQSSPALDDRAKTPPWKRSNYMAPEDYARAGFVFVIPGKRASVPRAVGDQGGFAMIQSRIRRKGSVLVIQRKIYLN